MHEIEGKMHGHWHDACVAVSSRVCASRYPIHTSNTNAPHRESQEVEYELRSTCDDVTEKSYTECTAR